MSFFSKTKKTKSAFERFMDFFNAKAEIREGKTPYDTFLSSLGGKQFGNGVFNTFSFDNVEKWSKIVEDAYPEFANQFQLFGYDWLGRCFGIDLRSNHNENILMFEIGTNEVLEIPVDLTGFLDEEIPLNNDACLALPFYEEWLAGGGNAVAYGRCIGYKVPLFLGGSDTVENLEDSDMDVYWSIIGGIKQNI